MNPQQTIKTLQTLDDLESVNAIDVVSRLQLGQELQQIPNSGARALLDLWTTAQQLREAVDKARKRLTTKEQTGTGQDSI